jgi:leader peptidase (prepilin peptidase)/N-methyltransferase
MIDFFSGPEIMLMFDAVIVICLLFIAVIDMRSMLIPDGLTLVIALSAATQTLFDFDVPIVEHLLGAALAFVLFDGTRRLMTRLLRHEAMGFGDVKLMTAGGLWIGAGMLLNAILIACFSAFIGFVAHSVIHRKISLREALPFGPFLALGLIVARSVEIWPRLWI